METSTKWVVGGLAAAAVLVLWQTKNALAAAASGAKPCTPPKPGATVVPPSRNLSIASLTINPSPTTVPAPVGSYVMLQAVLGSGDTTTIMVLVTGGDYYNGYTGVVTVEGLATGSKGKVLSFQERNLMPFLDPSKGSMVWFAATPGAGA